MNKIFNHWKTFISSSLMQIFSVYPLTGILVILFAILCCISPEKDAAGWKFLSEKAAPAVFISGMGIFLAETFCRKKRLLGIVMIFCASTIAIIFVWLGSRGGTSLFAEETRKTVFQRKLPRYLYSYLIILTLTGIYAACRQTGQSFSEYVRNVFCSLCRTLVISGVITIGTAALVKCYSFLILDSNGDSVIWRSLILVNGLIWGFGFLDALQSRKEETGRFMEILIQYILLGLLELIFIIVYLYIARILIRHKIPSNEVFGILSAVFLIGFPIWTISSVKPRISLLQKIGKNLPYFFIPFIALQGYTLGVRIAAFGITPRRYLGLVLIIFEISYILIYRFCREHIEIVLPYAAFLTLIAGIIPGINMFDLALTNQSRALKTAQAEGTFSDLSPADQERFIGAYRYLENDPDGKAIADQIPESWKEKAEAFPIITEENTLSVQESFNIRNVPIRSYSQMDSIIVQSKEDAETPQNPSQIKFYYPDGTPALTADLSEMMQSAMRNSNEKEIPQFINLPDGSQIWFTRLSWNYDADFTIRNVFIEGIWLH